MAIAGKRQSEYSVNAAPDALDKVLLCENPDPAGDGSVPGRVTQQANITSMAGETTPIQTDYTLQRNNEVVLVDTTADHVTVTVPAGWPKNSKFTVVKTSADQNVVYITSAGNELFQPISIASNSYSDGFLLVYQSESITYVNNSGIWYAETNAIPSYAEVWYVPIDPGLNPGDPGGPIDLTAVPMNLPLVLDTNVHDRSLLFTDPAPANGVLTVSRDVRFTVSVQVLFEHTIAANNQDVWSKCEWGASAMDPTSIPFPVHAAFAHTRAGSFGDTRTAASAIGVLAAATIWLEAVIEEAAGGSSSDIYKITATFKV